MSDVKLYLGDCLEVMKSIPDKSVDAVIYKRLPIITAYDMIGCEGEPNHEKSTIGKRTQKKGSKCNLDGAQTGNRMAIFQSRVVATKDSRVFWSGAVGNLQGYETAGYSTEGEGKQRKKKRQIQRWVAEYALSTDDYQRQVFKLWSGRKIGNSSQEWKSSRQSSRKFTGALRTLPQQSDQKTLVEKGEYQLIAEKRIKDAQQQMRLPLEAE